VDEFSFYTFCDRNYFETINRFPISARYSGLLAELLPESWELARFDIWLRAGSVRTGLKLQGFKIHVSSQVAQAETVLRRVVPLCVEAGVVFKVVADPKLHHFLNSKRYSRGGGGKLMTIYPPDQACFLDLIEKIHQATKDLEGPYILSDKRYRDSKTVFYRYGAFQTIYELQPDGTRRASMKGPDGKLIPDERLPYFQLPSWVEDPFPEETEGPADDEETGLLNGRYEVKEALSYTNTGGVYRAVDRKTGKTVVIKEARPHTVLWVGDMKAVDSVTALLHEHDNLRHLEGLPFVPELVELYQEWEHTFLVVSFAQGAPLAELRAQEGFILLGGMEDPAYVNRFCRTWRDLALRLLDAVEAIHERGVILGDISPGNVLMDRDTGEITLIDFEGALAPTTSSTMTAFTSQWFNPGFRHPERRVVRGLQASDDFYACGMLLYNLVIPIQSLFELDHDHPRFRILDHFIEAGLPLQVREVIELLFQGCPAEARSALLSWDPSTPSN
jgi:predicted Ser/Thr protein kinase